MEHTPEPWAYGEDNDGWYLERKDSGVQHAYGLSEYDARRIVACVNACAGITNEFLDDGQIRKKFEIAEKMIIDADQREKILFDQREELLSALKGVVRVADRATVEFDAARSAIAKAESK